MISRLWAIYIFKWIEVPISVYAKYLMHVQRRITWTVLPFLFINVHLNLPASLVFVCVELQSTRNWIGGEWIWKVNFSESQVDQSSNIGCHERENKAANYCINNPWKVAMNKPSDKASTEEINIDSNNHQWQYPRDSDNLHKRVKFPRVKKNEFNLMTNVCHFKTTQGIMKTMVLLRK